MANNPELQAKLDALLNNYRSQLPGRQKEINRLWQSVCQQQTMGEEGKELYRLVHSLSGSGASFGFSALSAAASVFELQLKACCDDGLVIDTERRQLMDKAHASLDNALKALSTAP